MLKMFVVVQPWGGMGEQVLKTRCKGVLVVSFWKTNLKLNFELELKREGSISAVDDTHNRITEERGIP